MTQNRRWPADDTPCVITERGRRAHADASCSALQHALDIAREQRPDLAHLQGILTDVTVAQAKAAPGILGPCARCLAVQT